MRLCPVSAVNQFFSFLTFSFGAREGVSLIFFAEVHFFPRIDKLAEYFTTCVTSSLLSVFALSYIARVGPEFNYLLTHHNPCYRRRCSYKYGKSLLYGNATTELQSSQPVDSPSSVGNTSKVCFLLVRSSSSSVVHSSFYLWR